MLYRTTTAKENGFDSDEQELYGMRHACQELMASTKDPGSLLDSILVVVNICEQRALLTGAAPDVAEWYGATAVILREALELITAQPAHYAPTDKLENPQLYFPSMDDVN